MMELEGKAVVVTGGSGIIGSLVASELSRRGGRVLLAGRDTSGLANVAESIPGALTARFDIREPSSIDRLIETAIDTMGGVDGIVNAAGVVAFGPLAYTSDATLLEVIETNLLGPLRVIKAAMPHMHSGFVVNITGIVADQPVAGMAAYSAAKSGLSAASVALSRELRREGILVVDARLPHTETGLASRPIEGRAPRLPTGLDPHIAARSIVDAIESERRILGPQHFDQARPSSQLQSSG